MANLSVSLDEETLQYVKSLASNSKVSTVVQNIIDDYKKSHNKHGEKIHVDKKLWTNFLSFIDDTERNPKFIRLATLVDYITDHLNELVFEEKTSFTLVGGAKLEYLKRQAAGMGLTIEQLIERCVYKLVLHGSL